MVNREEEEATKSDEENTNPDEENGKITCTERKGNCTEEFLAQPNGKQEKDCYVEKGTHPNYSNRSENSDMAADRRFDASVVEHWGGKKGSTIHEKEDKEELNSADRKGNRKANSQVLCVEIKSHPKDENASSPLRGRTKLEPPYPGESFAKEEASVAGGTGQMGHTCQPIQATQAAPNRSNSQAGPWDEKSSGNFTCTREHLDLGNNQQSRKSGHMHNRAEVQEDEYSKIGTDPTVSTIGEETICGNDSNKVSVKFVSDFHACNNRTEKMKEEIFGAEDEEDEIMREGKNDREGAGENEKKGELTIEPKIGVKMEAKIEARMDAKIYAKIDARIDAKIDAKSEPGSEIISRARNGTPGESPSTDQSVSQMSHLGHTSSKYTQSAFSNNTNGLNDPYDLPTEEISQKDVIIKKKNFAQEGTLESTWSSGQDNSDDHSDFNRTVNYKIGQKVLLKGTGTSEVVSDDSRGSSEEGANGEKGNSTYLPNELEEHASIFDEKSSENSSLMGTEKECIRTRVSGKSGIRAHAKAHAKLHTKVRAKLHTQSDEASITLLDAHLEEQSNFQSEQNRRERKGTNFSEKVKKNKKGGHFLNISRRGSNTIRRTTNLSVEHHHYGSFFHPKGKCATPGIVKYEGLRGENLSPNFSGLTQKKDSVNENGHDESEEEKLLIQHSDKGKIIKENCKMDNSDMIEFIVTSHGRTSQKGENGKEAKVNADVCADENNIRSRDCYVPKQERKFAHSAGQSDAEKEPPSGRLLPEGVFPYEDINHGMEIFVNSKSNELSNGKDKIKQGDDNVEKGPFQMSHLSTTPEVSRMTRMSSLKKAQENKGENLTKSNYENLVVGRITKKSGSPKGRHHQKEIFSSEASLSSEGGDEGSDGSIDSDDHYDEHDDGMLDETALRKDYPSSCIRRSGSEWKNGSPIDNHQWDGNIKSEKSDVDEYNRVGRFHVEGRKEHPNFYEETCEDSSESDIINNNCRDKVASRGEDYYSQGVQTQHRLRENRQNRQGKHSSMSQLNRLDQPDQPDGRSDAPPVDLKSNYDRGQGEARAAINGRNYLNKAEVKMENLKLHNGMQRSNNGDNSTLDDEFDQWKMEGGDGHADDKKRKNMFQSNGGHRIIKEVDGTWKNDNWVDATGVMKLGETQRWERDERIHRGERNKRRVEEDKGSRNDDEDDNNGDHGNDADRDSVESFGRRTDRAVPGEDLPDRGGYNDVGDEADAEANGEVTDGEDASHLCEIQRHIDYIMQNDEIDFSRINVKPSKNYVKINSFIDRYVVRYDELQDSELLFCFGESSEEDVMTRKRSSMKEGDDDGDESQNDKLTCMRKKNGASSYKKKNKQQKNRKINYDAIDTMWQPHFHPHNKEFRVRYRYKGSMRLKTISCKNYGYIPSKKISILFLFRWLLCGKYIAEKTKRSRLSITDINDCNLSDLLSKRRNKNNGYLTDDEWKALEEKKSKEFYDHVYKINDFLMRNYKDDSFVNKLKVIISSCDKQFKREEVLHILNQCLRDKLISERNRESLLRGDVGKVDCTVESAIDSSLSGGDTLTDTRSRNFKDRRDQQRGPTKGHLLGESAPQVYSKKRKRTFNLGVDLYTNDSMDGGSINHSSGGSSSSSNSGSNNVGDNRGKASFASNKRNKEENNPMWMGRYSRPSGTDTERGNNGNRRLYQVGANTIGMNYLPVHSAETELSDKPGGRNPQLCNNKVVIVDHGVHIGHVGNLHEGGDVVHGRSANVQANGNVIRESFTKAGGRSSAHHRISRGNFLRSHPSGSNPPASYPSCADLEKLSNTEEIRDYYNSLIELKKSLYIRSQDGDMDDQVRYANMNDNFMELLNKESLRSSSIGNGKSSRSSHNSMDPQFTKESDAFLFAIYYANRERVATMVSTNGGGGDISPPNEGVTTSGRKVLSPPTCDGMNTPAERMEKVDLKRDVVNPKMDEKNTEMVTKPSGSSLLSQENNYLNVYPNLNHINSSKKISNVSTCPSLGVSSYSVGGHTQGDKKNGLSCSISNERNDIGKDVTKEEKLDHVKEEQLKRKSLNMVQAKELFNSCEETYSQLIFSERSVFLKHVQGDKQNVEGSGKSSEEANRHGLPCLEDASNKQYRFMDRHNSLSSDKSRKGCNHVYADDESRHLPVREKIVQESEKSMRCTDGRIEHDCAYEKNPRGFSTFPSQSGNSREGGFTRGRYDPTSEVVQADEIGCLKKGNILRDENMKDIIDILVKSKYLRGSKYEDSLSSNVECSHERGRSNSRCLYCACMAGLNYNHAVEGAMEEGDNKNANFDREEDNMERHPPCEGEENNLCNSSCRYCSFYTELLKVLRQNKGVERGDEYGLNKGCNNVDKQVRKYSYNIEGSSSMREYCSEEMLTTEVSSGNGMLPVELCNRIFNYMLQRAGSELVARGSAKEMPHRSEQYNAEMENNAKQRSMGDAIQNGRTRRTKREIISALLEELLSSLPMDDLDVECSTSLSDYTEGMTRMNQNREDENGEFADYVGENAPRYDHSRGRPYDWIRNVSRNVASKDELGRPPLLNMPHVRTNTQRKKDSSHFARQAQTKELLPIGEKQTDFIMSKDNFDLIANFINDVKVQRYSTRVDMKDHRTFHDRENSLTDHILPQQSSNQISLRRKKKQNGHADEVNDHEGEESESEMESEENVLGLYRGKAANEKMLKMKSRGNMNNLLLADSVNK
ncbi:Uncharacterized protein PCOAH_00034530 [Plasmodium coatneyi]|uniref:Uncharacterized protein n=1 Tax=Plasmodium coatneyi TaxID=208452 RepID=A0A1B1E1D5_9APIC|nr:Uncharacterized protein PCOAH_00034530 [Plasmodium coatneyi]ANQ08851.1 Uncharacterized protein PCOAH_00034530 [Plasmodium coatneyi]